MTEHLVSLYRYINKRMHLYLKDYSIIYLTKNLLKMSGFTDRVKGNWNELKGKIKQEYAEVTEDDLAYEEGQEDEMLGRIQKKIGKSKQEVKDWIDSL